MKKFTGPLSRRFAPRRSRFPKQLLEPAISLFPGRKQALRDKIKREMVRQGLKLTDFGSVRLGRFMACVMARMMTNPLPKSVSLCMKDLMTSPWRR